MSQQTPAAESPVSPTTPEPAAAVPARPGLRRFLTLGVPALAAIAGLVMYLAGGRVVSTENAFVKADKLPVSAEVGGAVREVLVEENASVAAGQPLFKLDPAPFELAVRRAEARLANVRTDLAALQASYREKQAEIELARSRAQFAQREEARQTDLAARNFISSSRLDESRQARDVAGKQVIALERDLARIGESLGGSERGPIEQHPAYLAAQAELAQARLDLTRSSVHAPMAGVVGRLPKLGQFLPAGSTAAAIVASDKLWVEANLTESELTHIAVGQAVRFTLDTYPGRVWKGRVESLAPATGAEFSLIPAQNATGNWVKVAQRVPVRVSIEPEDGAPALRSGMSAEVEIDTGHRRRLFGLSL